MKYIVFDLETTGLPKKYNASPELYNLWPYIVQFSWIINNNEHLIEKSYIIKPDNYIIPDDSIKIHKISNEEALTNGVPIENVLDIFKSDCNEVDYLVSHNASFDTSVLFAACYRKQYPLSFNKKVYCTMKSSTDVCKLENKNYKNYNNYNYTNYKYPKLEELYQFLFGEKPNVQLHNSLEDARVTLLCYKELLFRNILMI